jgi:hypothetical protein
MIGHPTGGTAAMIYSMRTSPRWLRQAIAGIDRQLAALCRQHWRRPRAPGARSPDAVVPEAAPIDPAPR